MTFSPTRLTPLFAVALAGFAAAPVSAQFTTAGGLTAPVRLPNPAFHYGGLGYGGLGYGGWGTQWMQNPYQGYLDGAANVTMANAQYQLTIQQAKQEQEVARRSALKTRRATIEERQYELSLMPDPEQMRQDQLRRGLQRSRNNPPSTEIWSGKALNDMLRGIQDAHTRGVTGPDVSLNTQTLQHINLTTGTTSGGTGLLKNDGKLAWPYVLRKSTFSKERNDINAKMQSAVKQAQGGEVSADLLDEIGASLKKLEKSVDSRVEDLTPTEFIQASRYVRELKDSFKVLQQNDVAKYFKPAWKAQGSTVGELVRQMTAQGLFFAPAVSGDETYYTSLHRSMVDYDMGLAQLRTTGMQP